MAMYWHWRASHSKAVSSATTQVPHRKGRECADSLPNMWKYPLNTHISQTRACSDWEHECSEDHSGYRWSQPAQQVTYLQYVIHDRCQTHPMRILPTSFYCRGWNAEVNSGAQNCQTASSQIHTVVSKHAEYISIQLLWRSFMAEQQNPEELWYEKIFHY